MGPSATELIRRRAGIELADTIRAIATNKGFAFEHEMATKAVVDPVTSPLSGMSGYDNLLTNVERRSALGRIGGVEVPFSTACAAMTTPPEAEWVGHAGPKPVTKAALTSVNHHPTKVATLLVLTDEQIRFSGERGNRALERMLVQAAVNAIDSKLLSADAVAANVSPAGLGNGLIATASGGLTDALLFADLLTVLDGLDNPTIIAGLPVALRILAAVGVGADLLNVVVSPLAGDLAYIVEERAIAFSLGAINVESSGQASIQMANNPSDGAASLVSAWQTDSVVLRVSVYANWTRIGTVRLLDFS